jgi:FkbM family methyltransferase
VLSRARRRLHEARNYRQLPPTEGVTLRELTVCGVPLRVEDFEGSLAALIIADEIGKDAYDFSDVELRPGDTVVDLGAHVGMVSMFLAKAHPDIRVIAYEPVPPVFGLLQRNLRRNRVANVTAVNMAVTGDGRTLDMVSHLASNSGGGTASFANLDRGDHQRWSVPSTTLDAIFSDHGIERCPLLKIDVEGGEYEVLLTARSLDRVDHIRGEFHENTYLQSKGYSMDMLRRHLEQHLPAERIRFTPSAMAEG